MQDVASLLMMGLNERFRNVERSGTLSLNTFLDSRFKMQAFSDRNEATKTKEKVKQLVQASISKNDQTAASTSSAMDQGKLKKMGYF